MQGVYFGLVALMTTLVMFTMPAETMKAESFTGYATQVYILLYLVKVTLDDAVHFSDAKKHGENWSHGIGFSILWTLLMISALRVSVSAIDRASFYIILANLVGLIWIVQNYLHKNESADQDEVDRHRAWAWINCIHIAFLSCVSSFHDLFSVPDEGIIFVILSIIVLYDFLVNGSLKRMAATFKKKNQEDG
ncbi:hypothetical protein [Vibrio sp. DNB22_19_2]